MFAEKVIKFLLKLDFKGQLPEGTSIMNPYRDNREVKRVVSQFYNKFYNDTASRYLILGINPGRFGAGVTGIPFTDSKRLAEKCGLQIPGLKTFETSSVFIYEMIDAFGGPEKFYGKFFISAVCPLGFTSARENGNQINYNYYDNPKLMHIMRNFIVESLKEQLNFGIDRRFCFCLGTGKNFKFLFQLNSEFGFFEEIVPLEHPRFIMQYKLKNKDLYIGRYLDAFNVI
jgi:hypothetical protein